MFCCFILSFCSLLPFLILADEAPEKNQEVILDEQIQALKERLLHNRSIEMDEEVKGQELMIADWEAYRNELELIRQQKEENQKIQKEIERLEQLKAQRQ